MHESMKIPVVEGRVDGTAIGVDCPYCGHLHRHSHNNQTYSTHRVSHCHLKRAAAGYMVVITEKSIQEPRWE